VNLAAKQLIVMVADMERAVAFYRDTLGVATALGGGEKSK
jgi:hypothetical protein